MLEFLSSSALEVLKELEEKRVIQSIELEALQEECPDLNKNLLNLSDDGPKEASFHNVLHKLKSLVPNHYDFHGSFKFVVDHV